MLILTLLGACGGRESGTSDGTVAPPNASPAGTIPIPSCGAICDHIVGACVPGASDDSCVGDCERAKQQFASCSGSLDAYLVCMGATKVECRSNEVVVLDCSAERTLLEMCAP